MDRLGARARQLGAHRLAVQRVGHVDEPSPAVGAALHELASLQRLERGQLGGLEQPDVQRSADRDQLEHATSARAGVLDAQVHELRQPRPGRDVAAPPPDSAVRGEQAAIDAVAHQLAQEQGVASCQFPKCGDAAAVDRAAQRGVEEGLDLAARELAQLQQHAQLVLPQRPQGIGSRLVAPHAHHRERLAGGHELVHQRRGRVVEQLTVVDAQQEPARSGALGQRVARTGQQLDALRQAAVRGRKQRREGPQRDRPRRPRRAYPVHRTALRARELRGLAGEPRLADPGRPGDHDAARRITRERFADEPELGVAPYQRPAHARSVIDRPPPDQGTRA